MSRAIAGRNDGMTKSQDKDPYPRETIALVLRRTPRLFMRTPIRITRIILGMVPTFLGLTLLSHRCCILGAGVLRIGVFILPREPHIAACLRALTKGSLEENNPKGAEIALSIAENIERKSGTSSR